MSEGSEGSEGSSVLIFILDAARFLDLLSDNHVTLMGTGHMAFAIHTYLSAVVVAFLFPAVLRAFVVLVPGSVIAFGANSFLAVVFKSSASSVHVLDECTKSW